MKKKRLLSALVAIATIIGLTSCTVNLSDKNPDTGSSEPPVTSTITSSDNFSAPSSEPPSSEVPSSSESLSSHESSSTVSEIVSNIVSSKANPPAVKPADKHASSAASSAPPSSAPPASSEPVSSAPPASSAPPSSKPTPPAPPQNTVTHSQMKAVWISFLEFDSFAGVSESAFRTRMAYYYDTAVAKGLNTVLVQVRPHGDSMYESAYYPWSKHVSNTMGVGVGYDPVEIMVSEAHARGLEFHAWINPYRTMTDAEFATVPDSYPTKQWYNSANRAQYMTKCSDGRWWLNPGNSEAVSLIVNGATEIVNKYNVDGVHIDDYFYGGDPSLYGHSKQDAKTYTTLMIKGLYDGIKSYKPSVRFGVSPAGGFSANNSVPNSDLNYLSTDLALWCSTPGYIDYVIPQIYWDYNHSTQPFATTLAKWQSFVTADSVALYVGLGPYRLSADTVRQQMADSIIGRSTGYALFRFDHILGL